MYTKEFPSRANELIQYNHVIYTASLSYAWDNVYMYEREFQAHLAKFPNCSWAIILQQAWTMYLKDRVRFQGDSHRSGGNSNTYKAKKEIVGIKVYASMTTCVLNVGNLVMMNTSAGEKLVVMVQPVVQIPITAQVDHQTQPVVTRRQTNNRRSVLLINNCYCFRVSLILILHRRSGYPT